MIAIGAINERGRLGPALAFVFIWTTAVYDPIAYWTWNKNGWSDTLGVLDFAGGTPVHISSGSAALGISIYLGRRKGGDAELAFKPHNTTYVILGTVLLRVGRFGFNGGTFRTLPVRDLVPNSFENQDLRYPQTYGLHKLASSQIWPLVLAEPLGWLWCASELTFASLSIDCVYD
jgi:hypothetical protein